MLQPEFPGAVTEHRYMDSTAIAAGNRGFTHRNTLAGVATCRDELAGSIRKRVQELWGPSFDMASLAGMLTAGRTGLVAMVSHAPVVRSRRRVVLYAMTHIGLDADGTWGVVERPGLAGPTAACGALAHLRDDLESGNSRTVFDPFDIEQSMLTQRLPPMLRADAVSTLPELTRCAVQAIDQDLCDLLDRFTGIAGSSEEPIISSGAVFTGVQIHGPDRNYVWPHAARLIMESEVEMLDLRLR